MRNGVIEIELRIDGVIRSQAVLIATGINWEGRRQVLGAELANRELVSSWKECLRRLKERGLHGTEFVVSDESGAIRSSPTGPRRTSGRR